ncbi:hypothetical protein J7I44_00460 [Frateuria sp. MAH-13]|uniref:DUF3944 domain-containing protein n=1 Tax=Frateuria flava TaxID=2821489 RepID=A0ABS4DI83_9GAMM|nr:hypothetical protein [Frateuria flava]MBP1472757.1 hypothetical protein [Frateuria flava]
MAHSSFSSKGETMALKYRKDEGLAVLALSGHDDLQRLVRVLTHDESDGEKRRTQQLLDDPSYRAAAGQGDLRPAWKAIAAELQAYGGDSIANAWRSLTQDHTGVAYREIVIDICDHLKLGVKPSTDIKELEDQLLVALICGGKDKFEPENLARIMEEVADGAGLKECLQGNVALDDLLQRIAIDAKVSYLAALAAPAIASTTLPFLARLTLPTVLAVVAPRMGAALVPGLNVAAATSALMLLTSPAYRVTLPAVLEVIRIRRRVLLSPMDAREVA